MSATRPVGADAVASAAVIVVGSFNVDHVWSVDGLPVPGETRAGRYASGPGGKGFNQAVAAARAGASTRFVCALGEDAGGELARRLAADDAIELAATGSSAPTGSAGIFVDAAGRNSIVVAAGANAALDGDAARRATAVRPAPAVVLAQLETPPSAAAAAFEAARAAGATTVLNPAPANAEPPGELLDLVDVLTPNETEFAALLASLGIGTVAADSLVARADSDLHALCRQVLPSGTVVVTLGAAGCFVSHPAQALRGDAEANYRITAPAAQVVDTTGAGDAFNGALCASLATSDQPFAVQVRRAVAYASRSTERAGAAVSMPTLADVVQRYPGFA